MERDREAGRDADVEARTWCEAEAKACAFVARESFLLMSGDHLVSLSQGGVECREIFLGLEISRYSFSRARRGGTPAKAALSRAMILDISCSSFATRALGHRPNGGNPSRRRCSLSAFRSASPTRELDTQGFANARAHFQRVSAEPITSKLDTEGFSREPRNWTSDSHLCRRRRVSSLADSSFRLALGLIGEDAEETAQDRVRGAVARSLIAPAAISRFPWCRAASDASWHVGRSLAGRGRFTEPIKKVESEGKGGGGCAKAEVHAVKTENVRECGVFVEEGRRGGARLVLLGQMRSTDSGKMRRTEWMLVLVEAMLVSRERTSVARTAGTGGGQCDLRAGYKRLVRLGVSTGGGWTYAGQVWGHASGTRACLKDGDARQSTMRVGAAAQACKTLVCVPLQMRVNTHGRTGTRASVYRDSRRACGAAGLRLGRCTYLCMEETLRALTMRAMWMRVRTQYLTDSRLMGLSHEGCASVADGVQMYQWLTRWKWETWKACGVWCDAQTETRV
ncbi:hypothetical protein C8R44DRAFT_987607 [Mycena epipterygia]|nr:hypothetical protein C8R44DRAFT_987607 [Mycena epipterygia]